MRNRYRVKTFPYAKDEGISYATVYAESARKAILHVDPKAIISSYNKASDVLRESAEAYAVGYEYHAVREEYE